MILENVHCKIEIIADETYTLQSTDNKLYDYFFNPDDLDNNDFIKVFSITITKNDALTSIALIGSLYANKQDCAILNDNLLIVLMNNAITTIDITSFEIVKFVHFGNFGTYFSIFTFDNGYIIYGEEEIVKLDLKFNEEWSFSGADIFATYNSDNIPFQICGNKILLYDWNGIYYELDNKGNIIQSTYK